MSIISAGYPMKGLFQCPLRLLTDFLISRESSKVSFELPEGFSVTAEKWQQQGMF